MQLERVRRTCGDRRHVFLAWPTTGTSHSRWRRRPCAYGAGVTRARLARPRRPQASTCHGDRPRGGRASSVAAVLESLEAHKINVVLYDYVRVEPRDKSIRDAIDVAHRERSTRSSPSVAGRHRHREGGESLPPRIRRLISSTTSTRRSAKACRCLVAQAADGDSDDGRTGARPPASRSSTSKRLHPANRHLQPAPQADARLSRSRQHADHAARGRGVRGLDILSHAVES